MKIFSFVLIIAGFSLSLFSSIKYFTRDKIVDIGAIQITRMQAHHFYWSPSLGILFMIIGFIILWKTSKN